MSEPFVVLGPAVEILRIAFDVRVEGEKALRARVRQLAVAGIPRSRGALHERLQYGLLELSEIAIALALANAHVQPAQVTRCVREAWLKWAPLAHFGIGNVVPIAYAKRRPARVAGPIALIPGTYLKELGTRSVRGKAVTDRLPEIEFHATNPDLAVRMREMPSSTIISASAFMPTIFRLLSKHAAHPDDMKMALDRLRRSERDLV
jgi:hypothetical protein